MKRKLVRIFALVLALVMLTGCGAYDNVVNGIKDQLSDSVTPGATIGNGSTWINSDIAGAVDESVTVSEKDDFHTAVNRDWILETKLSDDVEDINSFTAVQDTLDEQVKSLLTVQEDVQLDESIMSLEDYRHLEAVVTDFAALASDTARRDELGVEPLRKYIERIESISTLDELTEYMKNEDGMNVSLTYPVYFEVDTPPEDRGSYTVYVLPCMSLSLGDQDSYTSIGMTGVELREYNYQALSYVLGAFGYTDAQVKKLLRDCYSLETSLARAMLGSDAQAKEDYMYDEYTVMTFDELSALAGAYPLADVLTAYGLGGSDGYTVYEASYLSHMGKLYTNAHLNEFKAFFTVQTVLSALDELDSRCYELYTLRESSINYDDTASGDSGDDSGDEDTPPDIDPTQDDPTAEKKEQELFEKQYEYVSTYLSTALDELYIARYCTAEEKQQIKELIDATVEHYRVMLAGEDWLGEETREKAIEKLDNIYIRALYPDELADYSDLSIDPDGTLVDAANAINSFNLVRNAEKVNQPINKDEWPFTTINVNAMYMPTDNSINILAGLLADGFFFDADAPEEQNLGRLGMVIGHEISHAFDTSGYHYDKDGVKQSWWTSEDEEAFRIRAARLSRFYAGLTPIPNRPYTTDVTGEAIADMGGLKCMLTIAAEREDFDYDLFFTSFAQVWRRQCTAFMEVMYAERDVHPLGFLRTNVTVSQFDEFFDTYNIKPGDGMYVAPEERINVW